ncbi:MAG: response regulator transcription factor [Bacteroidetes bacterium]|nr:response regulator transcription factor [Bacteroidota bacterium]
MGRRIHIAIAEPSVIIRSGWIAVLKRLTTLNIDIVEVTEVSKLSEQLQKFSPEILIVSPSLLGLFSLKQLRKDVGNKNFKCIAFQSAFSKDSMLSEYDGVVGLYDTLEQIKNKINKVIDIEQSKEVKKELSVREREIVVCVVKGMTNKQIADSLFLSTHTIMTHRRNIANKLQIHSSAGLTIYAIVNKLVELNDIKDYMFSED